MQESDKIQLCRTINAVKVQRMSMCLYFSIPANLCDYINKYYKLFDAADVAAVMLILRNAHAIHNKIKSLSSSRRYIIAFIISFILDFRLD